jgi:hypothetical protein
MEVEIITTVTVATVRVEAHANGWSATVNGVRVSSENQEGDSAIPFMKNEMWRIDIDADSGIIRDWPKGTTASVKLKVVDSGRYYLLDAKGTILASRENEYVPRTLCPKENGYGDYIILDIDGDGKIDGWDPESEEFCFTD